MNTYAFLDHTNIVIDVIEGEETIDNMDGAAWYEKQRMQKCVKVDGVAGIGMGYNKGKFLPKPHEGAIWDGITWHPSIEVRVEKLEHMIEVLLGKRAQ